MFRRVATLGILAGLLWAATALPASAVQPSWVTTQVSTVIGSNHYIAISGDRLAWMDDHYVMPVEGRHMYTWKAGDAAPTLLDAGNLYDAPQVSGDTVAWTHSEDGIHSTVFLWNALEQTTTVVATSAAWLDQLAISGDRLAWHFSGNTGDYVVSCRVGESQHHVLRVGTLQANRPQVSGDRVVWMEDNGSAYNVATWQQGDLAPSWVTTSPTLQNDSPVVSGDRIAWKGQTAEGGWAVFTKTTTESAPTTLAVSDTYYDEGPVISGDRVAWRQVPPGGTGPQVFTWSATDPVVRQVSQSVWASWVAVSDDRVAWTDMTRIMTWAAGDTTASLVATGSSVGETKVSGNRIAWRWNLGAGDYRIMTAVLTTPVVPPVKTKLGTPTISPTKPTHNRHAHFYSVLTPGSARTAVGATTTLKLYRRETHYVTKKVNGRNRRVKVAYWHLRHSVLMKRYSSTSTTVKMTATVTPKYAGSWKAVVVYGGASGFTGSTSPTKYFTVK